jgi:uncharacterized protein (TIRG00374 family)
MTTDTPAAVTPGKPKFGKSQIIATILTLLILVMVFVALKNMGADYGAAWTAIKDMAAWELGLITLATIALIIIYVTPYTAALPGLAFKPAFYTRQTSFMISNVIPGGGAWGLAVQYGMLSSYGYGPAPASATIGITSVWNTFVTLSLPVVALVGLAVTGQSNSQATTITLIAALVVVAMIGVFALILRSESFARKLGGWTDRIIDWGAGLIHKTVDVDAVAGIVHFRNSIVDVVHDRWLLVTLANVGQQLAQFSILYLAVVALQGGFDGPVSLIEAFAAFAFGRLATFIPVPPGGLGTTDAIITAALTNFGMDGNAALAATMVWRAATYFPQVIIGVITMLLWRREQNKKATATAS